MFNSSNPTGHQDAITYSSGEARPSPVIQSDIDFDRELEELVREASPSLQGHVFNKFQRLVSYLKREKQGLDTEKKKIEVIILTLSTIFNLFIFSFLIVSY